ncbi:MAG: T9SS type A sorting domain-containing protein, partial [Bacteroidota bacterium]
VEGEYAHYNFYVNEEFQFDGDTEPIDYDDCIICDYKWTEVPISEIETVMVEFDNDLQTATEDRNLNISSIVLEPGDGFHPEDGNYYTLSLNPLDEGVVYDRGALDGVDVVPGTNVMDVNGFMIFPVVTSDLARYGPRVTKSSPVAETTFSEPASVALEEGSLLIYPNPARDQVEVNLPLAQDQMYTLQLYDLYGREVFRQQGAGSVTESIPLQGQPRGTYLVAVQTGGQRLVQKLVIDN